MSIQAMKAAIEWIEAQPEPRMLGALKTITALRAAIEAAENVEPDYRYIEELEYRLRRQSEVHTAEKEALYLQIKHLTDPIIRQKMLEPSPPIFITTPQPAIPEGWISVSERLPDHRNECLVYSRHIEDGCVIKQSHLNPAKTDFYREYSDDGETPLEEITHWMPLPAAPKPEK